MAAKPIERFVKQQIQEQGGWPRILERIASGETITEVAQTLKRPDGQWISRNFLSGLLHKDPERSAKLKEAQIEGASAMVDDALLIVDRAPPDRDSVNKAKTRADVRLKVASLRDRDTWGDRAQVQVNVNVASLHLDSLRTRTVPVESEPAYLPQPTEVETVHRTRETTGEPGVAESAA